MLKKRFFGLSVFMMAAILVFTLAGCGDEGSGDPTSPGGTPKTVTYTGTNGSDTYKLEITENTSRAAYAPVSGDNFKFIEVISTNNMWGTVEMSGNGQTITLHPNNGSGTITVTVSGNTILGITGMALWDNNNQQFTGPGNLDQGGGGGSLSGTYTNEDNNHRYIFSGSNYTTQEINSGWENQSKGTYILTQWEITLNQTHFWGSDTWVEDPGSDTFTISISGNSFTIYGTTYTKLP